MTTPQNLPNPGEAHVVQFRIERGANAIGTDGVFGTVQQIVVDHETGQLRALIIRSDENLREFELPASHVRHAHGQQVELDLSRAELAAHPEYLTPYDPSHYVPLYEGVRLPTSAAGEESMQSDRPVVTRIEGNAAELVSADRAIAPDGEEDTIILHQPAGQTAPVYQDRAADQRAVAAAEGLPSNLGRPATTPTSGTIPDSGAPALDIPPVQAGTGTAPMSTSGTPATATPNISVVGKGPDDLTVNERGASTPTPMPMTPPSTTPTGANTTPMNSTDTTATNAMPAEDLIAREAPPTPVDHQLPAQAATPSPTSATPAATLLRPMNQPELPAAEPSEVAGPQRQLPPASPADVVSQVPWGAILPLAGVIGAGIVFLAVRRARRKAKRNLKAQGNKLQRTLREQAKQVKQMGEQARDQLQRNVAAAQQQTPPARDLARQMQGNLGDAMSNLGQTKDSMLDSVTHLPERARWFARGAKVGARAGATASTLTATPSKARWFTRGAQVGAKAGAQAGSKTSAVTAAPTKARWFARGAQFGTQATTTAQPTVSALDAPDAVVETTGRSPILWVIPVRRGTPPQPVQP